jgi:uncharacterized protein YdaU (DUF1376 family)
MSKAKHPAPPVDDEGTPYLAIMAIDIERWQASRSYRRMSLAAQGAYMNLWFSAWKAQPSCVLPDDDRELWRLANAPDLAAWQAVKSEVFLSDAWAFTPSGWLHEIVLEVYQESLYRHRAAVRSGRIAGKASARARRAASQARRNKEDGTTVQRPLNDRPTAVNPPSPSPSPSPSPNRSTHTLGSGAGGAEHSTSGNGTARPARPPATHVGVQNGITYDPDNPDHLDLVERCSRIAVLQDTTAREVLRACSETKRDGAAITDGCLVGVSAAWLATTRAVCERVEGELLEEDDRGPPL